MISADNTGSSICSAGLGTPDWPAPDGRRLVAALVVVYGVWGTAFLAIQWALDGFPPLLMVAARYLLAGGVLYTALRLRGRPRPTARQGANAAAVGVVLLAGGSGGQHLAQAAAVPSGIAALGMATVPLWMALAAGLWGLWPSGREWAGLGLGFAGVAVYAAGGGAALPPSGLAVLLAGAVAFAVGSVWRGRLALPPGLMGTAVTMLAGGGALSVLGLARGESVGQPPGWLAVGSFAYLTVFSSFLGLVAYEYLLDHARPALAGSCAYVNPIVAMLLGAGLAGEPVTADAWAALAAVALGVGLIALGPGAGGRRTAPAGAGRARGREGMVTIRPATTADLDAINRIHNHAIRTTVFPGEEREKTAADRRRWFRRHGGRYPVLVAELDGEVVGWACLSPWSEYEGHQGTAEHSVYVAAARRGQGVGRRLLDAVVAAARGLGYHVLVGRIAAENGPSLRLHAAAGFETVGRMREVARVRGQLFDEVVVQLVFPGDRQAKADR